MTTQRFVANCRKVPSESNCSLLIAGTEDEVLSVLGEHVVTAHGHPRGPQLITDLKGMLEKEGSGDGARERNRELAVSLYDAFNRRDFDSLERLASPSATMTNIATGEVFRGAKGFRTYAENWSRAFPDARAEIDRVIANDDGVVTEFTGSGTHKGVLAGPGGTIQPTGRRLNLRFVESLLVRDGKILEGRVYFDSLGMMSQLGIGPQLGSQQAPPSQVQAAQQQH